MRANLYALQNIEGNKSWPLAGHKQRRALALPQRKALWYAESETKNHGEISNFHTFLLYLAWTAATLATLASQQLGYLKDSNAAEHSVW